MPPTLSPYPIKAPSPLEPPFAPSLLTQAPYRTSSPPQSTALPCPPLPGARNKSYCPHSPSSSPPRPRSPHPRRCSTCGRAAWTPKRSGLRGSAPPQKVGAPTPGSAHMSLAGRFFPSTMRMDSELRLAIAGPRRGVRARGSRTPGSGAAGRRAGSGLGAAGGGPRRAREVNAGAGESLPLHSPPAPAPRAGAIAPGRANRRPGLPVVGGAGPGRSAHWPPGGRGGACAKCCCPAG